MKPNSTSDQLAKFIRTSVVKMTSFGGSSHVGSCLSIADILGVLYSDVLNVDPKDPQMADRDMFVLSKGHAGAAVYAALAGRGFIEPEMLENHYENGSIMSGHVSHKGISGVEVSTGSLGQGLSLGAGMALASKLDAHGRRVVVLMSDGECDEGSVWEAAMFAAHFRLRKLMAVIDYNKLQSIDTTEATMALEPFEDKWRSFGWEVRRTPGHDHDLLRQAMAEPATKDRPVVVICDTTKGKGVSFMENSVLWHYRSPDDDERQAALEELSSK
ncbi:transketolase [Altererythrobacter xiamenensis]|uniref:Transketolase n=1 Tax=Altererythrobacter xiamenensis TaxID=1316679 RepID=A0A1Y6F2P7_9SPHN|nr:transketolase [Altererythrobacter xiamenensis]SMQ69077.1 transketolase [Altererythrobacter xiamenensis]